MLPNVRLSVCAENETPEAATTFAICFFGSQAAPCRLKTRIGARPVALPHLHHRRVPALQHVVQEIGKGQGVRLAVFRLDAHGEHLRLQIHVRPFQGRRLVPAQARQQQERQEVAHRLGVAVYRDRAFGEASIVGAFHFALSSACTAFHHGSSPCSATTSRRGFSSCQSRR